MLWTPEKKIFLPPRGGWLVTTEDYVIVGEVTECWFSTELFMTPYLKAIAKEFHIPSERLMIEVYKNREDSVIKAIPGLVWEEV